uniref:Uncharacterized protein n=1 Tax=Arundo donax TaxID=35708 RepID=A0A0A9BE08_ARUDO
MSFFSPLFSYHDQLSYGLSNGISELVLDILYSVGPLNSIKL